MISPARKTAGILTAAGAVAVAAALLTMATRSPSSALPVAGDIQVRASLQSSHVLVGTSDAHMAVTVRAPDRKGEQRPPMKIAIVIDRSGSMSGEPLENAKAAARQLVSRLDAGDRFSIVAYGSDTDVITPSTVATNDAKQRAMRAIDAIYDDGGTNLSGGLIAGRDELLPYRSADSVSRIVLISDGQANEGIADRAQLADLARATSARGLSITTIGVGLDFDEHTMTTLAVSGAGNYYFAESSDMLAQIFDDELTKVGQTVATDVRVALTPAAGVEILEAYGYDIIREGGRTLVNVADLRAGETRKVIVRVRVTAAKPGALDIASVAVSYRNVDTGKNHEVAMTSRAEATRSEVAVRDGRDKDATRHIERARTASAINMANAAYDRGDYASAQKILEGRRVEAAQIAAEAEDDALAKEVGEATGYANRNMQAAPSARGSGGAKAKKSIGKKAYDLMY